MAYPGLTPTVLAEMTLAQIFVYWMEAKDPGDKLKCKPSELAGLQERIKFQRQWWEERVRQEVGL